jgi:hypothetical protein
MDLALRCFACVGLTGGCAKCGRIVGHIHMLTLVWRKWMDQTWSSHYQWTMMAHNHPMVSLLSTVSSFASLKWDDSTARSRELR